MEELVDVEDEPAGVAHNEGPVDEPDVAQLFLEESTVGVFPDEHVRLPSRFDQHEVD